MESVVDVYVVYHMFPVHVENNVETIQDISLLIFRYQKSKCLFYTCQVLLNYSRLRAAHLWVFEGLPKKNH